jgi:glycosyltransferase involved in cell wall biosynthesis
MKVVLVGSSPNGGLLYHPVRLAIALRKLGIDVIVATRGGKALSPTLYEDLKSADVPHWQTHVLEYAGPRALMHWDTQLRRRLRDWQPDIVHVHGPISLLQLRMHALSPSGPRFVASIQAMGHEHRTGLRRRIGGSLGSRALNLSAASVVPLCEEERHRLSLLGVSSSKLRVAYNAIDVDDILEQALAFRVTKASVLEKLGLPPDSLLLGCFANFQQRKRQDLLLEAFETARRRNPRWTLLLAGKGERRAALEDAVVRLGLGASVRIVDRIPSDRVYGWQAACDAIAHVSNAETFCFSVVEPLILGKRLLATTVGVGAELAPAPLVRLIPPDDLEAMRQGLLALLEECERSEPEADAVQHRQSLDFCRRKFSVDVVARRYVDIYRECLERGA